jgi:anti-sigma regulatory factor (Ser/Thr protein kinase)
VAPSTGSVAAWSLPAVPSTVGQFRRRAAAFASAAGASEEMTHAVALAVSETVTNVVMHAYVGKEPGVVSVQCRAGGGCLTVRSAMTALGSQRAATRPASGTALRPSAQSRRRWK